MSLSTIGLANGQTAGMTGGSPPEISNGNYTTGNIQSMPGQTSASCTQDDINAAKQGLVEIQKKISDLRTQYHNDWQTAYNSGQYNGTWEQYSRDKISSSADISQIKSDYQKFNSILRSCNTGHMQIAYSSSTCSQSDITNARQELATAMKQGMGLRNKAYQQFQQDRSSGQFNGTWNQYAQQKFHNLPEVLQSKSTHDKYSSFLKSCFGKNMPHQQHGFTEGYNGTTGPQGTPDSSMLLPQDNSDLGASLPSIGPVTMVNDTVGNDNIMHPTSLQSLPDTISSPKDALGTISSSSGLPAWVKGIAGWWAEGKISDDEFVKAIQFLVHQGIIKV